MSEKWKTEVHRNVQVWELRERWGGGFDNSTWSWFGKKLRTWKMISVTIRDYFWKRQGPILWTLLEFHLRRIFHGKMGCVKRELIIAEIEFRNCVEIHLGRVLFTMYCMNVSAPPGLVFVKLNREN